MMSLKILSAAAILTLALPVIDSTASYAQAGPRGGPHVGGGGPRAGGPGPRFNGGGGPRFNGGGGPRVGGGGGWRHGGGGGGGFIPGAIAGAVIGGALAGPSGYYGNSYGYYGNSYYDGNGPYYGGPYDDGGEVLEVAPAGGDDAGYCMQTYKSYDPRTGTYLGYDGLRHPCP